MTIAQGGSSGASGAGNVGYLPYAGTPTGNVAWGGAGRSPAAGGFTPNDIAGLLLWLNAGAIAGNDGDAIATWANQKTGGGDDYTQGTGAKKPLLKKGANGINGQNVVLFDGVDDWLGSTFTPSSATKTFTQFLVFQMAATPGSGVAYTAVATVDTGSRFTSILPINVGGYRPYTFMAQIFTTSFAASGIADALDTNAHVLMYDYNDVLFTAPTSYACGLDGTTKSVVASGSVGFSAGTTSSVGARVVAGAGVAASYYSGKVAEYIYYSGVLSAPNIATITAYLKTKYGIA